MGSEIIYQLETFYLSFDVQASLDNNFGKLAVNGQETSVADKSERTFKVLGKADSFEGSRRSRPRKASISPESTVCTLQPSQYLPCGIGVHAISPDRYDLTWLDIRRWKLGASAIVEILKSSGHDNLTNTEKIDRLRLLLEEHGFCDLFEEHIPNLKEMPSILKDHDDDESLLKVTRALFLFQLRFFIPLTAAYGGIHLSTWNFEFPSRIESIIWRTACFIIMGSFFPVLAMPSLFSIIYEIDDIDPSLPSRVGRVERVWQILSQSIVYGFMSMLFFCYVASRSYLVVESFISLRHVPIGVYAAVPWVQNIPHV